MLQRLGLVAIPVGSCSVGVRSSAGEPILKPWLLQSSCPQMPANFADSRCDRSHKHVPCAGKETEKSAYYLEQMCRIIHRSFQEFHAHEVVPEEAPEEAPEARLNDESEECQHQALGECQHQAEEENPEKAPTTPAKVFAKAEGDGG